MSDEHLLDRTFGLVGIAVHEDQAVLTAMPDYTEDDWDAAVGYLADNGFHLLNGGTPERVIAGIEFHVAGGPSFWDGSAPVNVMGRLIRSNEV